LAEEFAGGVAGLEVRVRKLAPEALELLVVADAEGEFDDALGPIGDSAAGGGQLGRPGWAIGNPGGPVLGHSFRVGGDGGCELRWPAG
jgi:hypothetical protein